MNFYDVYTTLSVNPSTQDQLQQICDLVQCQNSLEPLKQALWKRPSRAEHPGMFPFDEETGRIYDSLWKAAQAENYSALGRFGRWLMRTICPPADDEGMAAYHRKARQQPQQHYEEDVSYGAADVRKEEVQAPVTNEGQGWEMSDDQENEIVVKSKETRDDAVMRRSKKGD